MHTLFYFQPSSILPLIYPHMSKVVLITGISSGFGKYTSEYLIGKKYIVYGTARKQTDVKEGIQLLIADVTDQASVDKAIETIIAKEGRIDVLINNAGMGLGGPIEDYLEEEAAIQMNTNFMGTFRMCKSVLPQMRKQKSGLIINTSSIGGLMGLPFQGFYSASKYAVEGFSEALRYEVKNFGINVVLINPGDFKTQFTANRKSIAHVDGKSAYYEQFSKSLSIIEKDETNGCDPIMLARKIACIIEKKNPSARYIIASFEQKFAVWLKNILPEKIFFMIIGSHYGV
jgi:NAD(P)-dependent dehydrogenase (short-subunit alcohol dehydrogenase family)